MTEAKVRRLSRYQICEDPCLIREDPCQSCQDRSVLPEEPPVEFPEEPRVELPEQTQTVVCQSSRQITRKEKLARWWYYNVRHRKLDPNLETPYFVVKATLLSGYLDPRSVGRASMVSHEWRTIAYHPRALGLTLRFEALTNFNEQQLGYLIYEGRIRLSGRHSFQRLSLNFHQHLKWQEVVRFASLKIFQFRNVTNLQQTIDYLQQDNERWGFMMKACHEKGLNHHVGLLDYVDWNVLSAKPYDEGIKLLRLALAEFRKHESAQQHA